MRNDRFYQVDSVELVPYTIIVTTTMTARMLWLNGVEKGYFTHILIDEAAQVSINGSIDKEECCRCEPACNE